MDTKNKKIIVKAFVIYEELYKEYDKKLYLLTDLYGKICVYAHGVRRQNSKNLNSTSLFTYGEYELVINNNFYTLSASKILKSFVDITTDYDNVRIATYFLELLNSISYENMDTEDNVNLLYYSLCALLNNKMDKLLIKSTFELKILQNEGLISNDNFANYNDLIKYTCDFVLKTNIEKLFSFNIKEKEKKQLSNISENLIKNNFNFESKILKKF